MNGADNNCSIAGSHSLATKQVQSETTTGISAGRSITVSGEEKKEKTSLLDLSAFPLIFRYLKLRDIRSLEQVCTYLHAAVKENNALAKAWYRQFFSTHQYQLRTAITTKNDHQFRSWFESFSNDKALVDSLTNRKREAVFCPALLYFNKTNLMSECKTFKLETKDTIHANAIIRTAALSVDGRYLVTAVGDDSAMVYAQGANGSWVIKTAIIHNDLVTSANFSLDGRHVVTASRGREAKIYSLGRDESWETNVTVTLDSAIRSASFSPDSQHVVIVSMEGMAQIHSLKNNGSWELKANLYDVRSATFSADSRRLMTAERGSKKMKIHSQNSDGSWEVKNIIRLEDSINLISFSPEDRYVIALNGHSKARMYRCETNESWKSVVEIQHKQVIHSATFSADGRHVATASLDGIVKIYGQRAGGLWEEKTIIDHKHSVESVTFSPDSRHLVTTGHSHTAKIIGQEADGSWVEKASITHASWILSATFSADSSRVITAGCDGTVQITELQKSDALLGVSE